MRDKPYMLDNAKCPKCGGQLWGETWESSDGAYEDWHEWCEDCKYERWVDGPDS